MKGRMILAVRRLSSFGCAAVLLAGALSSSMAAYASPPPVIEAPIYVMHFKVVRGAQSQRFVLRVDGPAGTVRVMVSFVKKGGTVLGPYYRTIVTNLRQVLVFHVSPKIRHYRIAAPA